jgi:hypothetical protein
MAPDNEKLVTHLEQRAQKDARFKIDACPGGFWDYAVYKRRRFLWLFPYWSIVFKTDYLDRAAAYIAKANTLPRYY